MDKNFWEGKAVYCFSCGEKNMIKTTRRSIGKPYFICSCGVAVFWRMDKCINLLKQMLLEDNKNATTRAS